MAGLWPLSRQQIFKSGRSAAGARLFLFDGGTTTPRVGYRDSSLSSAHPNPIVADADGRLPIIFLDTGFYRQRLTTSTGTLIYDDDGLPVVDTVVGGAGTSVDPDSVYKTRDVKIRFDDQPLAGYVRVNGRTIGSAASGATERANADTQSLFEELWGFANISVTGGKGANAPADFAANKPLVLPNAAGRGIWGADDLGAGAQGIISSITNPTLIGSIGGAQTVTLIQANIPAYTLPAGTANVSASGVTGTENTPHTHAVIGTTGAASADHTHSYLTPSGSQAVQSGSGTNVQAFASTTGTTGGQSASHTHAVSITSGNPNTTHIHSVTVTGSSSDVTIASGGSGTAVNKLPPLITFTIYIRL